MITLIATYVLNPGHDAELQEYLREVIPATRAEPGCHTFDVNRSKDDELTLVFYERYEDEAALDAHRETPHFKRYIENGLRTIAERRFAELYTPFE
jgi:quinol monooxygenase YgiN